MLSTPQNLADSLKKGLMEQLVDKLNVKGVCMVQQSLLSLYSYKATSGIILDMGHRIEVLPIFEGEYCK
jgi:actin-related protein